ncbi:DUF2922 domain-containing protein [Candidatus Enterococcus courvalinii]|uniref:DUF2922 domain-containing protein n=1 Tax=Candidatus Enterococcus courvalinii TaxID=2815329 RepID=A0ABS3HYC2_9ENTE|nr:DUF2922 domain-containing protein [Enterococcus sp. MSG2901]MBO0481457.1 DUF2922 domain-containing protein [Enterococcus sp. MSG2901]
MKKLQLIFSDSEGKNQRINPVIASNSLTAGEVQEMMRRLSELNLSVKEGVTLYAQPLSAKYIETIETILF